jgi:hypothetical protein
MENKIKLSKALVLNKATITKLQESQMSQIKGGLLAASCVNGTCIVVRSCNSGSCNGATA